MADVHSKEIRSYNMSRIKGKNTKPEILVRKFLHANGFRYKLHDKSLPGQTGIVAVSTAGQTAGKRDNSKPTN
jgi:DNA mismatch endonuclease (patch repair protein)